MIIGYRKEQKLSAEHPVNTQYYEPVNSVSDVISKIINPKYISDIHVRGAADYNFDRAEQLSLLEDRYVVLSEGLMRGNRLGVGYPLVVVLFNYSKRLPLIDVPGFYRGNVIKDERKLIRLEILSSAFCRKFFNKHLKDRYNGQYFIWPDVENVGDIKGTSTSRLEELIKRGITKIEHSL